MGKPARSREATKQETREALLRAGIAEFSERGLAEPSLDAICARAGYTRGAFYVHFEDRDDFIDAVMEFVLALFIDAVVARGDRPRDLEDTVERFCGALAAALDDAPSALPTPGPDGLQFHRVLEACSRSPEFRGRFAALLQGAIERTAKAAASGQVSDTVRRDVDAQQVATLLVALALGALSAVELGVAFEIEPARDTVLALLRPPAGPRAN